MSLTLRWRDSPQVIGQTIAHYKVTAKLGAGGMGEVYRATDTKLGRDVALKVLPEAFAQDAQRMARFHREAKVLASLNHPNIAAIYGLEEAPASAPAEASTGAASSAPTGAPVRALAMELVEGPTLAERIAQGALPLEEALPIARQIAEALEYAHEKGIIHRDLKPANIKLTPDGQAKVLDFGLAKALEGETSAPADSSHSPTLSFAATRAGIILGTAAYMAPEQARGAVVDRRADIWAFGCVLYEMLAGRRAFSGDTASDTLAAVLKTEPDWNSLPAETTPRVRELLHRCLQKDRKQRLQAIGDARLELAAATLVADQAGRAAPFSELKSRSQPLVAGVALGLIAGVVITWSVLGGLRKSFRPGLQTASRLSITLPAGAPYDNEGYYPSVCLAISRDGSRVVYSTRGKAPQLYLRRLDELEVRPIPGTEGGTGPFFSPDGEWVGFFTIDGTLKKVSLAGGNPIILARGMPYSTFIIGSWSDDGRIVFDTWNAGLRVVSASGGAVKTLTAPQDEWHQNPQALPGSDTILYLALRADSQRIEALSLTGGAPKVILENASHARYLASGHLLFVRDGGLMVAPFDAQRLEVTGPAAPVSVNVMFDHPQAYAPTPQLAVSLTGTLVYAPGWSGGRESTLVWVDRSGRAEEFATIPVTLQVFQLSPDGGRLALASRAGPAARIQTLDLATRALTRIADEPQDFPMGPAWSPDGRRVFFARYGTHQGALLAQNLDSNSPPQRMLDVRGTYLACSSVSRDGRFLFYTFIREAETGTDIWVLDLAAPAGAKEAARPFLTTSANEDSAVLSPDGRWLAYSADESGAYEIYIRRFPGGESKQRVSTGGGLAPQWSADGRELFFQADGGSKMMAAPVRSEPDFRVGEPRVLFEGPFVIGMGSAGSAYAVSRDARRFLMVRQLENPLRAPELIVVQNWFAELKDKQKP